MTRAASASAAPKSDRLRQVGRWSVAAIASIVGIAFVVLIWQRDRAQLEAGRPALRLLVS